MEQKFTKHLIEIGVIDKKTESQILSLYREKYLNFNFLNKFEFNESMTEILFSIFNNLTEIQKKYICFHLPAKFIKLSKKNLQNKLKNIFGKKIIKNKLILWKYLFKWYKNMEKTKNNISLEKNIFRQKSKKSFLNANNKFENKYSINDNIRNFLDIYDNYDNLTIKNYQSNLTTLNNEKKNKSLKNKIKHSNKTPNKMKFLYSKDIIKSYNMNLMSNNITNDRSISTITNNKKKYTNNMNYMRQMKRENKDNKDNKYSNNDTIENIASGLRDSNESNYNCLSTNLNTINNRYNNNQENKTLSHSEYIPSFDLLNNYNIKTYKKLSSNSSSIKPSIKGDNNYFNEQKTNKNNKIKNKTILMQNILNEDLESNYTLSPITKSKSKKSNNNNIFNLIYCNNYNNMKQNNYMHEDYNLFNCQTPFCQTLKNSKSSKENSACNRLFEDGKKRLKMQNKKIKDRENIFVKMACRVSGERKNVDLERINNLYRSKERSNTFEKTKNKVEQEEGLTFKPIINKSEYSKRINGNFMDRNLSGKSKEKKNNEYKYKNNKMNKINYHKKFTKMQKEKIVNGVINRLYSNSLYKSISDCCNKYTKGIKDSNLKSYKKKLQD